MQVDHCRFSDNPVSTWQKLFTSLVSFVGWLFYFCSFKLLFPCIILHPNLPDPFISFSIALSLCCNFSLLETVFHVYVQGTLVEAACNESGKENWCAQEKWRVKSQILRCINRTVLTRHRQVFSFPLYRALVSEYYNTVLQPWCLNFKKDAEKMNKLMKRATKIIWVLEKMLCKESQRVQSI